MLPSRGLMVLIVDDDTQRATATAKLVRLLGSVPVIAMSEPVAARLLPDVDVVLATASPLAPRVLMAARSFGRIFRCLLHTSGTQGEQRGLADVFVRQPFTAIALGDILAKAFARRRALKHAHGEHAAHA